MFGFNKIHPEVVSLAEDLLINHHNWRQDNCFLINKLTKGYLWTKDGWGGINLNRIYMFNKAEKKVLFNAIGGCNILNTLIQQGNNND